MSYLLLLISAMSPTQSEAPQEYSIDWCVPELREPSEKDVNNLARIINAESRGESFRGKLAAGQVVLNRLHSPLFPNTLIRVIQQKGQFDGTKSKAYKSTGKCKAVARLLLQGYQVIPKGVLYFANEKISTDKRFINRVEPYTFAKIGGHSFYFQPDDNDLKRRLKKLSEYFENLFISESIACVSH